MPFAVLSAGVILIGISIYLASRQPEPVPQIDVHEIEELISELQYIADDAIARLEKKLAQVKAVTAERQLSSFAQEVAELAATGLSHEEIAAKLGRGKGEIQLALGIANFSKEQKR